MSDKIRPWGAAIFGTMLCLTTLVFSALEPVHSTNGKLPGVSIAFFSFLPMCFIHVCAYLDSLRKENIALNAKLEELLARKS